MARTILDIYNAAVAEMPSQQVSPTQTLDQVLSSPSKVSIWSLWLFLMATCQWIHETLWDQFQANIQTMIAPAYYGTIEWWQQACLNFQTGYALDWIDNKFQYNAIDTNAQIIARAAAVDNGNSVTLKVATVDSDNNPIKLTSGQPGEPSNQLLEFQDYIKQIKPVGQKVGVISYSADILNLDVNIYYDPLVLTSTGTLILDGSTPIINAINNYLAGIKFGGELNLTQLTNAILAATGVTDVVIVEAQAKPYYPDAVYTVINPEVNNNYVAVSGYFTLDSASSFNYIYS